MGFLLKDVPCSCLHTAPAMFFLGVCARSAMLRKKRREERWEEKAKPSQLGPSTPLGTHNRPPSPFFSRSLQELPQPNDNNTFRKTTTASSFGSCGFIVSACFAPDLPGSCSADPILSSKGHAHTYSQCSRATYSTSRMKARCHCRCSRACGIPRVCAFESEAYFGMWGWSSLAAAVGVACRQAKGWGFAGA